MSDIESNAIEKLPCGYCRKTFEKEYDMIVHIHNVHQHLQHEEENGQRLKGHETTEQEFHGTCRRRSNGDENPGIIDQFECYPCEMQFKDECDLADHIHDAHNKNRQSPQPSSCKVCHKTFVSPTRLKEHQNVHVNRSSRPRPYSCSNCDKSFFTSSDLWSHQRIHSGSKYTCGLCGKKLASSGSLHNHQKSVHEVQKKFECQICLRRFALKQKLENHVMNEHEGQKPFRCENCDQGFVHKQSLEAHQRRHDGIVLNCKLCSKPFHDAGYFKETHAMA